MSELRVGTYDPRRDAWAMRRITARGSIELVSGVANLDDVALHASALGIDRANVEFSPGSFVGLRARTRWCFKGWYPNPTRTADQ